VTQTDDALLVLGDIAVSLQGVVEATRVLLEAQRPAPGALPREEPPQQANVREVDAVLGDGPQVPAGAILAGHPLVGISIQAREDNGSYRCDCERHFNQALKPGLPCFPRPPVQFRCSRVGT
jgi:hypothetical protein